MDVGNCRGSVQIAIRVALVGDAFAGTSGLFPWDR